MVNLQLPVIVKMLVLLLLLELLISVTSFTFRVTVSLSQIESMGAKLRFYLFDNSYYT